MYTLSARLKTIADKVDGGTIADIGTDHGYLPIFLIRNKIAQRVIACDIRQKPLDNAAKNIAAAKVQNIELRLCDGLEGIKEGEVNTVIIAGMGGEVIAGIIDRCSWIKSAEYSLVLQPMTSADALRLFLCNNGFCIENETAVLDGRKIYTVISARFSGEKTKYSDAFLFTGRLNTLDTAARQYIEKQLCRISKCRDDLKNIPAKAEEYLYYKNIADEINKMLGGE